MDEFNLYDFRNYAFDMFDYDCGTLAGLEKYIEWIEELICDDEKLQKVKSEIRDRKTWMKKKPAPKTGGIKT